MPEQLANAAASSINVINLVYGFILTVFGFSSRRLIKTLDEKASKEEVKMGHKRLTDKIDDKFTNLEKLLDVKFDALEKQIESKEDRHG